MTIFNEFRLVQALMGLAIFLVSGSGAQDRRTVVEPKIPPACITLRATLALHRDKLDESDESRLDTDRVQQALERCGHGKAVELALGGDNNAFLIGPIRVPEGVTLLVDRGVTLIASRDARLYDLQPDSCGLVNERPPGCKALISVTHASHAAIMGDGIIDGRGGEKLLNSTVSWWDLAERARAGGRQQVPRLIVVDHSDDFTVYRITLRNSPNFHVVFNQGHGFTVWNLKINTPSTARNTDGVDPGSAEDITVAHSFISTGDDNIAIKGGGDGVGYMTVIDNHFYRGHGMSIGSETFGGVHNILVENLSLDGSDNGIRIKSNRSRGGLVKDVTYTNVCIRNSKFPVVFDTQYNNPGPRTDLYPVYRDIVLKDVRISGGGRISVEGLDPQHALGIGLDGVMLDNPLQYKFSAVNASIHYGPGPVNFRLTGPDVIASGSTDGGTLPSCNAMFVPFEERP
jgi:polygalacturonase